MDKELEVKFYPIAIEEIENKLKELGATLVKNRTLMKRVIYGQERNPQIPGNYLRIRTEGEQITLSLKINAHKSGKVEDQKELMVKVDSFDKAKDLFDSIGFIQTNYQESYRTTWKYKNSEIVIDEWPALEPYIEIEGPSEEELKTIANELGLNWSKKSIVSVDELYALKYNLSKEEVLSKISRITFEEIPKF